MASRGLRAVSLSGWIVITGLLLCDFRGSVGCSHEFGVVRLGVERIRSRYARGTELLQPISDLSDTLDQTTAAGSPRQPHPLLDGRLLLYCHSTSSTSTILTVTSLSNPLRTSEGALLLCQPPSHPQPPAPPLASDLSLFSLAVPSKHANFESDIPDQGHRRRHEAPQTQGIVPLNSQPTSGLSALSLATPSLCHTLCLVFEPCMFWLGRTVPIEETQAFMRKHLLFLFSYCSSHVRFPLKFLPFSCSSGDFVLHLRLYCFRHSHLLRRAPF